jgi:hypothetical protein
VPSRRSFRRDDRGVAASVAIVPAVVLLFFGTIQLCLWFYGREVATAAAQHGLDMARVTEGTAGEGDRAAREFLDQVGGLDLQSVSVARGEDEVVVTIVAMPVQLAPWVVPDITVTITGPVERVAP